MRLTSEEKPTFPILMLSSQDKPKTQQHTNTKTDRGIKNFVFGSISGMTGKLVEYPFDTIKVRLQFQSHDKPTFRGPLDCFRQTLHHEGFWGLYRGLSSPMVGAMIENAILFVAYDHIQMVIREYTTPASERHLLYEMDLEKMPLEMYQLVLAGGMSGILASFLLTPIELIKCKLQVQETFNYKSGTPSRSSFFGRISTGLSQKSVFPTAATNISFPGSRNPLVGRISTGLSQKSLPANTNISFTGPIHVIKHTFSRHGLPGFYQGTFATMLRESIGSGVWFGAYEYVSRLFIQHKQRQLGPDVIATKSDLNPLQLMVAGACAGMGYNLSSFPADSIKSVMQTDEENMKSTGRKFQKKSFFETGKQIYQARGIRGFYRGCGMTVARAIPSNAIIFLTYEFLSRRFK